MAESQTTSNVLMIRPVCFAGNEQTAASNRFQNLSAANGDVRARARTEFDALAGALISAGVRVHIFDDTAEPHTPDSIFPNNWISFHADGTAALYPMMAPNRRLERRMDILESLGSSGFRIRRLVDLSHREAEQKYLEGTGSLVLDRVNRLAYACLSPRTDLDVLGEFAQLLDYEIVAFDAADASGAPIYHTNVLLSIGTKFAVICSDAIDAGRKAVVCDTLRATGHEVFDITREQMHAFAGNILELKRYDSTAVIAMSRRAFDAFTPAQRVQFEGFAENPVVADIPTIETLGGGSVRCMLAEIHLPNG